MAAEMGVRPMGSAKLNQYIFKFIDVDDVTEERKRGTEFVLHTSQNAAKRVAKSRAPDGFTRTITRQFKGGWMTLYGDNLEERVKGMVDG